MPAIRRNIKMNYRKILMFSLVGTLACGVAAGCGSSGSAGQSTASEIVVGDIGPYSGLLASTFGAVPKVIDAWAAMVNAGGGLQGHKVRVIHKDVGETTGAGLNAIKELVTQDGAVAIISDLDNNDQTWMSYAQQKGIPVIPTSASVGSVSYSLAFPTVSSPTALGYGQADVAKKVGNRLGGVYCAEAAACEQNNALIEKFAGHVGLQVPVALKVSSALPDYTSVCQQFKDAKVDVYEVVMSSAVGVKIADTCLKQGLTVPQLLRGPASVPQWKTDPAFAGATVFDAVASYFDTTVPGVKIYRDALQKYAPSVVGTDLDNSSDLFAWSGAQLFSAALAHTTGAVTSAAVIKGLYAVKGDTLGGIVGPLTFTPGKPTFNNCYFEWKIDSSSRFQSVNGSKPICAPAALVSSL
jgi:branched-chain amino acid transport system substrate-binding protein